MPRILIVEDNDAVALGLQYALRKESFVVSRAATVAEAKAALKGSDLIILDIRLPDGDGFEFCRWLRAENWRQPVLMLTARDELIDKIVGLEVGADDYMTKPFELREVIARVRALMRRVYGPLSEEKKELLQVGSLTIDLAGQHVTRDDKEIHLTNTEFKLLVYLAQRSNRPQSRLVLAEHVLGYEHYVGDPRTIDVHIRNLRQKIELDPRQPQIIVTVRGAGYKLVSLMGGFN
jgi:two-component system alkaline phosphatase synthesis response regulator PhoP